jgi:mRNA (2'-O-methyladenosine-N6-)-methyltransferase
MSDDEYRIVAIAALNSQLASRKLKFPISLTDLLSRVVATKVPLGLFAGPSSSTTRFRLVDQTRFELIIENLSRTWDQGIISLSRNDGEMTILDITLAPVGGSLPADAGGGEAPNTRKRKRVIDEDADSAAGDEDAEDSFEDYPEPQPNTTLRTLSKELRDVYTILQQSTARGRLLAEQVSQHSVV